MKEKKKKKESYAAIRQRLYNEWAALTSPTIMEKRAFWAGFYRGLSVAGKIIQKEVKK